MERRGKLSLLTKLGVIRLVLVCKAIHAITPALCLAFTTIIPSHQTDAMLFGLRCFKLTGLSISLCKAT